MPVDYTAMSNSWNLSIAPAPEAFYIWSVIYPFLGLFTVYQALPEVMYDWAVDRNDDLIFNQISFVFTINMIALSAWQYIFLTNSIPGMILSLLDILIILSTGIYMMYLSLRATNNWMELIAIRTGLSIYCGWITAATILNISFALKAMGLKDNNLPTTEENFGIITIWIAAALYNLIAFFERDPIYGAIFLWALGWIYKDLITDRP